MKTFRFLVLTTLLLMITASLGFGQTPAKNKSTALAFYEAFNNRQWDKLANYVADELVDHALPPGYAEQSGLKGPGLVTAFVSELTTAFPDIQFIPKQCIAEGDLVMCYISMSGTHSGNFAGLPPTGKQFKVYDVDIIRFDQKGKAVEHWAIQDGSALMAFLGATPPSSAEQVARDFMTAMDANDLDGMKRVVAADYRIYHPNFPNPLTVEEHFKLSVQPFNQSFENFKHTVQEIHVSGNSVTMRGIVTGKHTGAFMDIPVSGNAINVPWLALATLNEEGKIKELHVQFNQFAFMAQIGVSPMAKK